MRLVRAIALGALLLAGASPARADPAPNSELAATPPAAQTQPAPERTRMRCIRERPTESFIVRRTCFTREEWEARQREAQETQRRMLDQRAACTRAGTAASC
jgi:hypothetical protein